jgi:hypothetical protein
MDLKQFGKRIEAIGDGVVMNSGNLVRKVAVAVDRVVVFSTPVDTGRARSNWQVELDAPAEGTVEPFAAGSDGSTGADNAQAAVSAARETIAQHKNGQAIHITNNLPYIGKLNDGSSAQAPAGFVQESIMVAAGVVQGACDQRRRTGGPKGLLIHDRTH